MSDLHAAIEHFENNPALRREFSYTLQAMKDARDALEQAQTDFELATNLRDEAVSDLYAANDRIEQFEMFRDLVGEWLYDNSKRQSVQDAYIALESIKESK